MKDYMILINEESKPVLVDISDNSKHIPISRVYGHLPFITGDMAGWYKNNVGQTFPLPTGYKVSFEKFSMIVNDWINSDQKSGDNVRAILSKLEQEKVVAPSEEVKLQEDGTNVIKTMGELNESIYKIQKNKPLTQPQVERVIEWMNGWEQLKDTAIPIRFKEDFS